MYTRICTLVIRKTKEVSIRQLHPVRRVLILNLEAQRQKNKKPCRWFASRVYIKCKVHSQQQGVCFCWSLLTLWTMLRANWGRENNLPAPSQADFTSTKAVIWMHMELEKKAPEKRGKAIRWGERIHRKKTWKKGESEPLLPPPPWRLIFIQSRY